MAVLLLVLTALTGSQGTHPDRIQQYLRLAEATLRDPITHEELAAAVLSPQGIASIRRLFERSIRDRIEIGGTLVTPELGGEATLASGQLTLVPYPDPIHGVIRRAVDLRKDPRRLLGWLSGSTEGRRILATTGGLHALLYQMAAAADGGNEAQRKLLDEVIVQTVSIHFKTWTADPEIQRRAIQQHDWDGRYAGFWHLHPPRTEGESVAPGIEPSYPDMTHAVDLGQFMTIVFQPDGFDLYDLSPLAAVKRPDLSRARVVSHRSREWEAGFRDLLRAAGGGSR